jgi:hypothetical protein
LLAGIIAQLGVELRIVRWEFIEKTAEGDNFVVEDLRAGVLLLRQLGRRGDKLGQPTSSESAFRPERKFNSAKQREMRQIHFSRIRTTGDNYMRESRTRLGEYLANVAALGRPAQLGQTLQGRHRRRDAIDVSVASETGATKGAEWLLQVNEKALSM